MTNEPDKDRSPSCSDHRWSQPRKRRQQWGVSNSAISYTESLFTTDDES